MQTNGDTKDSYGGQWLVGMKTKVKDSKTWR